MITEYNADSFLTIDLPVRVTTFKEYSYYVIRSEDGAVTARGLDFREAKNYFTIAYNEYLVTLKKIADDNQTTPPTA